MIKLPKKLEISDPEMLSYINSIRINVEKIWATPIILYFTNHNVTHSEKIITLVGRLLESLEGDLSETERFILVSAIYLHDIGMQSPRHAGLEKKEEYTFEELEKIRSLHNYSSEKMIFESIKPDSELNFGLTGCNHAIVKLIAHVAKCHRKCDITKINDTYIGLERVRTPLLVALLRLGDELDIDYERISLEMLSLINISTISKFHWWSHLYVQGIDVTNGRITLYFCFPEVYKESHLILPLINKSKSAIEQTMSLLAEIFYKNKLNLFYKVNEIIDYSETYHLLPEDLIDYIENNFIVKRHNELPISSKRDIIFQYNFLPPGSIVLENSEDERKKIKKNKIILDVGNKFQTGVIDTHILDKGVNNFQSTAGGVISCPNFILDNIIEGATEIEIVVHSYPDFDCFASVYLAKELILNGKLPEGYEELVKYVEEVDTGRTTIDSGYFYTPNIIARVISTVIINENPNLKNYMIDLETLNRGVFLITYLMKRLKELIKNRNFKNWSILSKGSPFDKEYNFLENDLDKYKDDLISKFISPEGEELATAEKVEIELLKVNNLEEKKFVTGLIWNKIPTCVLHKEWSRADENTPEGKGYVFTFIPVSNRIEYTEGNQELFLSRVIISVKPDYGVWLKGLGELLEKAEIKKEKLIFGDNVNTWRSRTIIRKTIKYAENEDPWYDGKGHEYTIVDSPGKYSLLSIDEIKTVLLGYANIIFKNKLLNK